LPATFGNWDMVAFAAPENRLFDRGHADIFLADEAATLYWEPILDWILDH
jgi:hypothetical protein